MWTAPVIAAHDTEYATSTSASGALVTYTAPTATDVVDESITVNCLPASGSTFAVGDPTVTCNASDSAGNAATTTTFTVHVAGDPVTATPASDSYTSAQSVVLSQSGATEIRYTTDDSAPSCASGSVYSGAIGVSASATIKALACFDGTGSSVTTFSYSINIPAPVQTSAPAVGINGPPVANIAAPAPAPVSAASGGGPAPASSSGGGAVSSIASVAPPGTANGTPIVETQAPAPTADSAAPANANTPGLTPPVEMLPALELAAPVLTAPTNVQSVPGAQVATVESGLPGSNYLWIFLLLIALLFGGWFVWNTFWTRAH